MAEGEARGGIRVRAAVPDDLDFMYSLAPRLAGVADLPWRTPGQIAEFQRGFMRSALESPAARAVTLIAAGPGGDRLGFVHAEPGRDSITGAACGYVTLLAVVAEAEGRGIARRLMDAVEDWARLEGFSLLTLDVFASNRRGRQFYADLGFGEEDVHLVKPL